MRGAANEIQREDRADEGNHRNDSDFSNVRMVLDDDARINKEKKMEHGKIKVEITETYPGSQHYDVIIKLPGMGSDNRAKFRLVSMANFEAYDCEKQFFRPEYAKAIKSGLEQI